MLSAVALAASLAANLAAAGPRPWMGPATPLPPPTNNAAAAACADATGERVRVMLPDLVTDVRFSSQRGALGHIVAEVAARVPGYEILSADEVRAALDQEANRQLAGCDDSSCLAELAAALDATLLVSGRLDASSDGTPIIALSLLNTRALVVLNRVTFAWEGAGDALPAVVRAAAQTLLLEPSARPPGALQVVGAPRDAQLFVDGVEHSASGPVTGLAIGPHELQVVAPGKVTVSVWAVVSSGSTSSVEVVLEDQPTSAAWLWLGGAAAVIAGGTLALSSALIFGKGTVDTTAVVEPWGINDVEKLRTGAR